jgi:hypothetical protein
MDVLEASAEKELVAVFWSNFFACLILFVFTDTL